MKKKRAHRYALQEIARLCLGESSRVATCDRVLAKGEGGRLQTRSIKMTPEGSACFSGMAKCGEVWTCPVCSSKISEGRRQEILKAMQKNRQAGGTSLLINITFSHSKNDVLKVILDKFLKALSQMKASREYKNIRDGVKQIGSIRALEVTHSEINGWHPHVHEIWFIPGALSENYIKTIEASLFNIWKKYAVKNGLSAPNEDHGVKIIFSDKGTDAAVGSYVAKFGNELTGAMKKTGNKTRSGKSPWGMLRTMLAQKITREKAVKEKRAVKNVALFDYSLSKLFKEYADAFQGKAQLFWSRGLKNRFEIDDVSDDAVATDFSQCIKLRDISQDEWTSILWARSRDKVLTYAESYPLFLDDYISKCVEYRDRWLKEKREGKKEIAAIVYRQSINHLNKLIIGN